MILTHKTGVLLHGTLAKDPVLKDVGQKQVLKFDVKAHSVKTGTGNWEGLYVQVNVWHGLDKWDGLLLKGDAVTVFARELKSREYNGKTYYDVDADDIQPGGMVIFRWMQNLIDLCTEAPAPPEPALTQEPTPFDEPVPVQDQPFRWADVSRRRPGRLCSPRLSGGSACRARRRHPGSRYPHRR